MDEDPFKCDVGSEMFRRVCTELNSTVYSAESSWSIDLMCGAAKFSDEVPASITSSNDLLLPAVTVLRSIWAYRKSLLKNAPRSELQDYWDGVKALAPNWAGFSPDRCLPERGWIYLDLKQACADRHFGGDSGARGLEHPH
jgi:hypothetical protein